jgi:thiamine kinase-like enzyme
MEDESPKLQEGSHHDRSAGKAYPANRTPRGAKLQKIYDVLARVPLFRDARWEDIKLEPLDSFTNLNYKVIMNDKTYVLRIAGEGTSNYIDRAAEEYNAQVATAAGLNAETLFFDANDGTMLSQFVEGSTMDRILFHSDPTALARAALVLKRLHTLDRPFESRFDAFAMIEHYLELLRRLQAPLPADFEEIKQEVDAVRQLLEAIYIPLTPCHNDTWPENFVEVGRRIYLIDWEYSGMNDPMWDLGNLSVEAGFRDEQDRAMMEAYCGNSVPSQLFARMVLYKATVSFFWALWSIVQYANNNPATDFWTYALNRFEHCKALMRSIEFSRHIDTMRGGY